MKIVKSQFLVILLGAFSERMGLKPVRKVMQVDSIDEPLRNRLWNALTMCYWENLRPVASIYVDHYGRELVQEVWQSFFKRPIDETRGYWYERVLELLKNYYQGSEWYEVYDFIEFMANTDYNEDDNEEFIALCNEVLKQELSAYRFVGGRITKITSDQEISEVEKALETPLEPIRIHLKAALDLLSNRQNPDYRNSIKESISAVESICNRISGGSVPLGQCLKVIEDKVGLHPALKSSFSSLYGYTSSAEGIRHALMDVPNLDFDDAKFMLVSCSAFINYLVSKASKAGIIL